MFRDSCDASAAMKEMTHVVKREYDGKRVKLKLRPRSGCFPPSHRRFTIHHRQKLPPVFTVSSSSLIGQHCGIGCHCKRLEQ
eukprot:2023691-Karenia_brevis.AAC.1